MISLLKHNNSRAYLSFSLSQELPNLAVDVCGQSSHILNMSSILESGNENSARIIMQNSQYSRCCCCWRWWLCCSTLLILILATMHSHSWHVMVTPHASISSLRELLREIRLLSYAAMSRRNVLMMLRCYRVIKCWRSWQLTSVTVVCTLLLLALLVPDSINKSFLVR